MNDAEALRLAAFAVEMATSPESSQPNDPQEVALRERLQATGDEVVTVLERLMRSPR